MKILNFGSLNIDYVYKVEHFVRPGETIQSEGMTVFCGGKGLNQSIALAKAGAKVYHAGKIGDNGDFLLKQLKNYNVNTDYIQYESGSTGHAIIQIDNTGQNCILLHGGANQKITRDYIDLVLKDFQRNDILLLQNEVNMLDYIIEKAFAKGMQIALNPSPYNESIRKLKLEYIKWFILNEIEGKELTGETGHEAIAEALLKKYPYSSVVLTLGEKGVLYKSKSVSYTHGIYDVSVLDTTGAGDTFTGYFIACITNNYSVEKALATASKASSISVSRNGASDAVPFLKEVMESEIKLLKR